jgi:hypothetical protein
VEGAIKGIAIDYMKTEVNLRVSFRQVQEETGSNGGVSTEPCRLSYAENKITVIILFRSSNIRRFLVVIKQQLCA